MLWLRFFCLGADIGSASKPVARGQVIRGADDTLALPKRFGTPASCSRFRPTEGERLSRFDGDHGSENNDWREECKNFFEFFLIFNRFSAFLTGLMALFRVAGLESQRRRSTALQLIFSDIRYLSSNGYNSTPRRFLGHSTPAPRGRPAL
jgi:hypothetical protein